MKCPQCDFEPLGSAGQDTIKIEHFTVREHRVLTRDSEWMSIRVGQVKDKETAR